MAGNLIRCSACGTRPPEKLSQVTWAWVRADGVRTAYRQRLCVSCFASTVLPLDVEIAADAPARCPGCGIDVEDNMDPIYCTAFVPGSGKFTIASPTCPSCAVTVRGRAQQGAEHLQEREFVGGQGQAPNAPPASSVWAALGITPRE